MGRFVTIKRVFREHPIKIVLASLCILSFMGLNFWNDYAPLSVYDRNKKEISRIKVANPEDFTFAVFGDNKGNHSFFEPLLHHIAQDKEIAFAIDAGDLVSHGKRGQYRRFLNQVQKNLTAPFLTAIGNHDLNNGSSNNYREIFGPTYYAFQIGQNYFFVLDATSALGFDKVERQWLEDELHKAQASKARFVFMHVPPFDPSGTYPPERNWKDLMDLLRRYNVTHLFTSHIHGYFSGIWEGVPYTITGGAGARLQGSDPQHFFHHYVKAHVNNGKVELTVRQIHKGNGMLLFFGLIEDHMLEWGLLLGAGISLLMLGLSMKSKHSSQSHHFGKGQ
jgi:serine/threonine-protein phosphatase CPPED1